jgi:YHS domain-containing protein
MNKLFVVLAGLSLMLMPQVVKAEDAAPAAPVMEEAAATTDAGSAVATTDVIDSHMGNKICPVSGKEIGEMGEGTEVEYNGQKIKLCCPDCVEAFNKDPEGYVKMLKEKMAAETPAADATTMEAAPEVAATEAPAAK